jgi:hypothetical protein
VRRLFPFFQPHAPALEPYDRLAEMRPSNSVTAKTGPSRNSHRVTRRSKLPSRRATHHHFPDEMSRTQPYDQPHHHSRKDGDDRLVHCPDALDLEVVRCDECADEEDAEDAEAPSGGVSGGSSIIRIESSSNTTRDRGSRITHGHLARDEQQ